MITQWVENHVGGRVVSVRREGRWRPAWYAEVDRDGHSSWLYVRGDRGHGFSDPIERVAAMLWLFERHGIPVPHVHGVMEGPKAIVMDKVPGDRQIGGISGPDGQRAAVDAYLRHLVRIHRIPVADAVSAGIEVPVDAADLHLAFHRSRSDTYRRLKSRPEPLIEFAMKWLARNVPTHRYQPAIATVDAGQFLVEDDRVTAIYDLELVRVTDPQADLAGLCIRNAFEPLGDIGQLFARYMELSGDAVDRATINFHTVVFALSANQAIARIRAWSARDWVQYFTWEVSGSLFAVSALAEELGVEVRAPVPPMRAPAQLLSDSLLSALDLWTAPEDPYERSLARDLIEHLRLVLTRGHALAEEHLDDVAGLVGRRAATVAAADADLERVRPRCRSRARSDDRRFASLQGSSPSSSPTTADSNDAGSYSAAGAVGPHIDKCYLAPISAMVR